MLIRVRGFGDSHVNILGHCVIIMTNWPWKDPNKAKDVFGILDDLDEILSDAKEKIELLQNATADLRDEHADPERLQDTGYQINERYKNAAKDFNDIAKLFGEKWQYYGKIKGDAKRQGKYSSKCPAAKNIKVEIQLYCAQETDMTDDVMRELEKKLTSEQFHHTMKLTVQTCKTLSGIQTGIPLIVICLNSSRLGVDLSNAISGIPAGSNTAVLIFHHSKQHFLPTQPSSTVLSKDEVKNVGIIIDVAFFEDMGLYDCEMNTNAYKALLAFIEGHCQK